MNVHVLGDESNNKGEWFAWEINRIYEETNEGIPGWGVPTGIRRARTRI
jgi:hypothetical protein